MKSNTDSLLETIRAFAAITRTDLPEGARRVLAHSFWEHLKANRLSLVRRDREMSEIRHDRGLSAVWADFFGSEQMRAEGGGTYVEFGHE